MHLQCIGNASSLSHSLCSEEPVRQNGGLDDVNVVDDGAVLIIGGLLQQNAITAVLEDKPRKSVVVVMFRDPALQVRVEGRVVLAVARRPGGDVHRGVGVGVGRRPLGAAVDGVVEEGEETGVEVLVPGEDHVDAVLVEKGLQGVLSRRALFVVHVNALANAGALLRLVVARVVANLQAVQWSTEQRETSF